MENMYTLDKEPKELSCCWIPCLLIPFTQQIELIFLVKAQQGNNLAVYSTQLQMTESRAYMYKKLLIFNIIMSFTFDGSSVACDHHLESQINYHRII